MSIGTWTLVVVIVIALVTFIIRGKRKTWYKVYTADPDILLLYRTLNDGIFRGGDKNLIFRNQFGNVVGFPNYGHWILKYEKIKDIEVEAAKKEIQAWKVRAEKGLED